MRVTSIIILFLIVMTNSFAQYSLKSIILDAGGKKITSTGYYLNISFGQPIASNILSSSNYRAVFGFYRVPGSTTGAYPGIEDKDINNIFTFPIVFNLSQNFPNPISNRTMIRYSIPIETDVFLKVYNNSGQMVGTLVNGKQQPGHYNVSWNINNVSKSKLPNGVYFYRLEAGEYTATKKMVILR